jgi:hypothetical protein
MFRLLAYAISAAFTSREALIAENLRLRQQLVVPKWRQQRPHLRDSDRRFWILVCRCFTRWREALIVVQPENGARLPETVFMVNPLRTNNDERQ